MKGKPQVGFAMTPDTFRVVSSNLGDGTQRALKEAFELIQENSHGLKSFYATLRLWNEEKFVDIKISRSHMEELMILELE